MTRDARAGGSYPLTPAEIAYGVGDLALENQIGHHDRRRRHHGDRQVARVLHAEGLVHLGDADRDRHHLVRSDGEKRP